MCVEERYWTTHQTLLVTYDLGWIQASKLPLKVPAPESLPCPLCSHLLLFRVGIKWSHCREWEDFWYGSILLWFFTGVNNYTGNTTTTQGRIRLSVARCKSFELCSPPGPTPLLILERFAPGLSVKGSFSPSPHSMVEKPGGQLSWLSQHLLTSSTSLKRSRLFELTLLPVWREIS